MSDYREESTPDLDDLQQVYEPQGRIIVPVRIEDFNGPIQSHTLPNRIAVMRTVPIGTDVQMVLSRDLRRSTVKLWAVTRGNSGNVYMGTDKNEVESGTAAIIPAPTNAFTDGCPFVLTITHTSEVWARATTSDPVDVSFVAEYWAD